MPIYEYQCKECGAEFSRLQSMSSTAEGVSCPKCGSDSVERKLSTFASTSSGAAAGGEACAAPGCGSGFT
jgi:putative FmdB family regulatory protein